MPSPVLYRGLELALIPPVAIDGALRRDTFAFGGASRRAPWAADVAAAVRATGRPTTVGTTWTWLCDGRAALVALDAFLNRCTGRLTPCWLPSWTHDYPVVAATLFSLDLTPCGYVSGQWPLFSALGRMDALLSLAAGYPNDPTALPRDISAAAVVGSVERLTVSSSGAPTPLLLAPQSPGITHSALRVGRLADDTVSYDALRGDLVLVSATVVTVPRETP